MPECIIKGHGIDIVDVGDFSALLSGERATYLTHYFTQNELLDIPPDQRRMPRLAGRFAAKEAILKSLFTGWGDGVSFTDIEILSQENGAPEATLHRKLDALAKSKNINKLHISISHTEKFAAASCIAACEI